MNIGTIVTPQGDPDEKSDPFFADPTTVAKTPTKDLRAGVDLIEGNLGETGPRSSYAARTRPWLTAARRELRRREPIDKEI